MDDVASGPHFRQDGTAARGRLSGGRWRSLPAAGAAGDAYRDAVETRLLRRRTLAQIPPHRRRIQLSSSCGHDSEQARRLTFASA